MAHPGSWLLTSRYFPPRPGGSSTVYTNLLRHLDQDMVYVLTGSAGSFTNGKSGLRCPREVVRPLIHPWVKGHDRLSFLDVLPATRRGIRLVRRHSLTSILATVPDMPFLVASYFIHRATGVPLYLYLHDTILEAQRRWADKTLARLFQRRILRHATKVFVLTPGLQEFYQRRYGLETILIPHCLDERLLAQGEGYEGFKTPEESFAAFSGAVYWLNADALRLFADAVHTVPGLHLQIASFIGPRGVEGYGIGGPRVRVSFLEDHRDVIALQRKARFLYLPLTFDRANAEEVDSAFPTKIIEYLVAGVPILVHAPASSLLARFSRQEECALVVDQPDADALAAASRRLLEDQELRQRLVGNALRVAQRFRGGPIAERLMHEMFGEQMEPRGDKVGT